MIQKAAYLCVGRIKAPRGLQGQMHLLSYSQDPEALFTYTPLYTQLSLATASPTNPSTPGPDAPYTPLPTLKRISLEGPRRFIVRISGIESRTQADPFTGVELFIARDQLPALPEDDESFYHVDLIGLEVRSPEGLSLGVISTVHTVGSTDMLDIRSDPEGTVWTIPFQKIFVPEVNLAAGYVVVVRRP